ncbi:hypothetical protein ETQ85_20545 [Zoogloea oleivorans]|uniref:Uncharacterized protein n=1 Tax=Zoogloea oleivorans TaxID=1552750 RepID=A0A6C2CJB4_9RHOO|nr:hypothetical protein [Zoogloea oleivorans]TYC53978.1 hypothetical protein ETQ85_20545 [Zoogloea oleivorans]
MIDKVKNNPFISLIRDEYKELWSSIATLEARELRSNGTIKPLTSRHKWRVYFYQERKILNAVLKFCDEKSIKIFAEHDGFVSNLPVNTNDLSDFVVLETGYRVKFSGEVLSPVLEASAIAEELLDGMIELDEAVDDDSDQDEPEDAETTKKDHTWIIEHIKSM